MKCKTVNWYFFLSYILIFTSKPFTGAIMVKEKDQLVLQSVFKARPYQEPIMGSWPYSSLKLSSIVFLPFRSLYTRI